MQDSPQFQVTAQGSEIGISMWIWILIIVIVLAVILIGSFFIYRGLGRMVECGECGALIPETSKRARSAAWSSRAGRRSAANAVPGFRRPPRSARSAVPSSPPSRWPRRRTSTSRRCAASTMSSSTPIASRPRACLGKKYSEAKFAEWWKKQPSYVTFERWLSQEEEKRKVAGRHSPARCAGP